MLRGENEQRSHKIFMKNITTSKVKDSESCEIPRKIDSTFLHYAYRFIWTWPQSFPGFFSSLFHLFPRKLEINQLLQMECNFGNFNDVNFKIRMNCEIDIYGTN